MIGDSKSKRAMAVLGATVALLVLAPVAAVSADTSNPIDPVFIDDPCGTFGVRIPSDPGVTYLNDVRPVTGLLSVSPGATVTIRGVVPQAIPPEVTEYVTAWQAWAALLDPAAYSFGVLIGAPDFVWTPPPFGADVSAGATALWDQEVLTNLAGNRLIGRALDQMTVDQDFYGWADRTVARYVDESGHIRGILELAVNDWILLQQQATVMNGLPPGPEREAAFADVTVIAGRIQAVVTSLPGLVTVPEPSPATVLVVETWTQAFSVGVPCLAATGRDAVFVTILVASVAALVVGFVMVEGVRRRRANGR